MGVFRKADYPNLLDALKITHTDVENWCEYYPLEILPKEMYQDDYVENAKNFPTMVYPFYNYILKSENQQMLHQEEFYQKYLEYYKPHNIFDFEFEGHKEFKKTIYKNAVKGRVYRTYPSLVRDLHFALYLKSKFGANAIFNRFLDVKKGIDVMLDIKNEYYGVKLFTKTLRAEDFKQIKDTQRTKGFSNVTYIPIMRSLFGKNTGSFYLFGDYEYNNYIEPLL